MNTHSAFRLGGGLVTLCLTFSMPGGTFGHSPTQGANDLYPPDTTLTFRFGGSYPGWVEAAYQSALETRWEQNNNSASPQFNYAPASGTGRTYYSPDTGWEGCDVKDWAGCARFGGTTGWKIWLRKDRFTFCEVSSVTGCFLAKRVILHEAEHNTLGVGFHDEQSANVTNMNSESPSKPNTGWDSNEPRSCDEAALQLRYGIGSIAGPYSGCLDHAPGHGDDGLITRLSLSTTDGTTCAGDSISRSGQLQTKTDTDYDRLSSVNIAQRTIWIDRDAGANGSWTNDWASDSTNSTGGNNWSHSFSENPAVTTSYAYRVHFKGQTGLDPDYSATFVLTFCARVRLPKPDRTGFYHELTSAIVRPAWPRAFSGATGSRVRDPGNPHTPSDARWESRLMGSGPNLRGSRPLTRLAVAFEIPSPGTREPIYGAVAPDLGWGWRA